MQDQTPLVVEQHTLAVSPPLDSAFSDDQQVSVDEELLDFEIEELESRLALTMKGPYGPVCGQTSGCGQGW